MVTRKAGTAPLDVIINWSVSSFFGWGVYGLNLALNLASDPTVDLACALPLLKSQISLDPLRRAAIAPFARRSLELQQRLGEHAGERVETPGVVLHCLDDRFSPLAAAHKTLLAGRPDIGVTFFQNAIPDPDALGRVGQWPVIVAGSTWNAQLLQAYGARDIRLILQGVDPTLFHPAPRQGRSGDRFLVFSGGKVEHRKGQDLVLAGFRRFAARRPDALLVTAWHTPWTDFAGSIDAGGAAEPIALDAEGRVDVPAWAARNAIDPRQVLDLGAVPNALLPPVLREMDVAVFPNRAEGGTNLVAMECMACGVPTLLSANTGHLDLIEGDNCYPLERQRELGGDLAGYRGISGWCESDPEEIEACLERAYTDREDARRRGLAGARTLSALSWGATARRLKDLAGEMAAAGE